MKLQGEPRKREAKQRAGSMLRPPEEPVGPEKPRLREELKKLVERIYPYEHGEQAYIAGLVLTVDPNHKNMNFALKELGQQVLDFASKKELKPDDFTSISDDHGAKIFAMGLLRDFLPKKELVQMADAFWEKNKETISDNIDSLLAVVGAMILLPHRKQEIEVLREKMLQASDFDFPILTEEEKIWTFGLVKRAALKLLFPERGKNLNLSETEVKILIKKLPELKLDRDSFAAEAIFGLTILTHPDVHLVPGVGIDFHPVHGSISVPVHLPDRSII